MFYKYFQSILVMTCIWYRFFTAAYGKRYNLTRTITDDLRSNEFIENILEGIGITDEFPSNANLRAAFGQTNFKRLPDFFRLTDSGELWTLRRIDRDDISFCGELKCCPQPICEIHFLVVFSVAQNPFHQMPQTPSISVRITLNVIDRNDHSPVFSRKSFRVKFLEEMSPSDQVISLLPAQDADSLQNGVREYYLVDPSQTFQLITRNNIPNLRSRRKLDYERTNERQFMLRLIAVDKGKPELTGILNITVDVEDVNDHVPALPFSNDIFSVSIPENTTFTKAIFQLNATDRDSGVNGELRYRLGGWMSPQQGVIDKFLVNVTTGELFLLSPLDYEVYSERDISIVVVVYDMGRPSHSVTATIRISVTDVNDNAPYFTITQNTSVTENRPAGELALRLLLRDEDAGSQDNVSCSVLQQKHSLFRLENTTRTSFFLLTNTSFDYEVSHGYYCTVICIDSAHPVMTVTHSLFVSIFDENDNLPVFSNETYYFLVPENLPISGHIGKVKARDRDDQKHYGKIQYYIDQPMTEQFSIYHDTGLIVLVGTLDYENATEFTFRVRAVDGGGQSAQAMVRVYVADVNDNRPELVSSSVLHVSEDAQPGILISMLKFHDEDSGDNGAVRVAFLEDTDQRFQTSSEYFELRSHGELLLSRPLDREVKDVHFLTIMAQDMGKEPLATEVTLRIIVDDVNDNPPKIMKPPSYSILGNNPLIHENTLMGTLVEVFRSEDLDIDLNADTSFHLKPANGSAFFRMNSSTGYLYTDWDSSVISPTPALYEIIVQVSDHGTPPLFSISRFYVQIAASDENNIWSSQYQIFPSNFNNMMILILIIVISVAVASALVMAIIWVRGRSFGNDIPLEFASVNPSNTNVLQSKKFNSDTLRRVGSAAASTNVSFNGTPHQCYYDCGGVLYNFINTSTGSTNNGTLPYVTNGEMTQLSGLSTLSDSNIDQYSVLQQQNCPPNVFPNQYNDELVRLQTFTAGGKSAYTWGFPFSTVLDDKDSTAYFEQSRLLSMSTMQDAFHANPPSSATEGDI